MRAIKRRKIIVSPNGKEVVCLYTESIDLTKLGELSVVRASDVKFNPGLQKWEINIIESGITLPEKFNKRSEAIQHEIKFLEDRL